jgi:hypothetical protein
MRAERDSRQHNGSSQFGVRRRTSIRWQLVGDPQGGFRGPGANSFVRSFQFVKRVVPHRSIKRIASLRKSVPPENVSVQPSGSDEYGSREPSLYEFMYSLLHRARVSIVECDRDARSPVSRLVNPIERRNIGLGCEDVEMRAEVALGNE